jgi:hypothetical protein
MELIDSIVHPGAIDLASQMHDDLEEMDEQLKKQYNRLQELRRAKLENPGKFYCVARGNDLKSRLKTHFLVPRTSLFTT